MKTLVLLALVAISYGSPVEQLSSSNTAYGYIKNYAIPLAEEIRKAEEEYFSNEKTRIIGGTPTAPGQVPFQAGLIASYADISGSGVCGGSLVSPNRVITAAHCWFDGINQAIRFQVVLGSVTLFSGGTRIETSTVAVHPNWIPLVILNDVAVIYLPASVPSSDTIFPVALPNGSELNEDFAGETAVASGFGLTSNDGAITTSQFLSHVELNVIRNNVCTIAFPLFLRNSNICTSGLGRVSTCRGDSGGPLTVLRNNRRILIGITSFGSGLGCDVHMPAVYARVTSFMDFFNLHI